MSGLLDPPVGDGDHAAGPVDAPLVLVMYGDFQCPYCIAAQRVLRSVRRRLGDRLRFVYRHFPIREAHPDAERAAEAAEAAAAQGRFWEMHDALYANAGRLDLGDIMRLARTLGLDTARFAAELEAGTYAERVQQDLESGLRSGVTGTPGFFTNGRLVEGAYDAASLVEALEASAGPAAARNPPRGSSEE